MDREKFLYEIAAPSMNRMHQPKTKEFKIMVVSYNRHSVKEMMFNDYQKMIIEYFKDNEPEAEVYAKLKENDLILQMEGFAYKFIFCNPKFENGQGRGMRIDFVFEVEDRASFNVMRWNLRKAREMLECT